MTWRRLGVLLRQLPPTARVYRAVGGEHLAWDINAHLLALVADLLAAGNWQRGGGKGRRPKTVPRPGQKSTEDKQFGSARSIEEARQILDNWSNP